MQKAGSHRWVFAVFVSSLVFAACSRKEPVPDAAENARVEPTATAIAAQSQALNPNPQSANFALYASNSISVQTSVVVNGGDVGVQNAGAGPFLVPGFELAIGGSSTVNTARNVIADSVQLGASSLVGSVQTNQLQDLGGVHGTVTPFVAMPAMPSVSAVTAGTTDKNVANGTSTTLPAAQTYRNLTIGNNTIVRLTGGVYNVAQVTIGTNSIVEALATAELHISGRLSVGTTSILRPASGTSLTARDLRIEVSGINGTSGALTATPPAASFAGTNVVRALVIVPNGLLSFGTTTTLTGAMFGHDVRVAGTTQVTYQDGFPNSGCPASCDDANPCTTDACVSGACTHTPVANGTACSDNNACNGAETCNASGTCVAGTPPTVDDGNPCTTDACTPATGVTHTPVAAGTSCSDNNACNGAETCNASGACVAGTPPTVDDGNSCTTDACDPATGVTHTPVAEGTLCSDNNVCNGVETCNASAQCQSGTPPPIDDGNPCTADTCDPAVGVVHVPVATGTSCSDGNACNGAETCNTAGVCIAGTPVVCTASDQCHNAGTCDPTTGACSNPAKPNGTTCTDGNACTQSDTCQNGTCTSGSPVTCVASDQCHNAGTCDTATGVCSNPAKADGTTCTDGNACTATDTCQSGACTGTGNVPTDDNNPCTTDACDPTGGVTHTPVASGTSCSDGNACNGAETCNSSGTCVAGTAPPVDDNNPCTTDSCDPATGVTHTPVAAGTSCGDGNACNGAETCDATGNCAAGTPVQCTAQDQCHSAGTCDPGTGVCSSPAKADGTACNDNNGCTQSDTCQSGTCTGSNPVVCTAQDQCHNAGTCDAVTGACSNPAKADGTTCSDGNACTATDTCLSGACTGTGTVATDDNNPCTTDACDPIGGVTHTPVSAGTSCTDGNACNGAETCDASGRCTAGTPVTCTAQDQCHTAGTCDPVTGVCSNPTQPDGTACNDGNACTSADSCQSGACSGSNSITCTASDQCHAVGTCDPTTGACSNPAKPDGASCDDADACTQSDQCQAGTCVGSNPVSCVATDACHQAGTCDPVSGLCSNPTAADGTACSSGSVCTTSETCQAGTCQGGTPVPTDDGDPCTLDTCDPVNGIVHHACTAHDRTIGTNLNDSTGFIYTGTNPVQTGVAPGTIVPSRVVVLHGRLSNRDSMVLPGATVTVIGHPEFGVTHTQGDGTFDMVVNGGATFRVLFNLAGYLPAERTVTTPWQEYLALPDVALVPLDPQVTTVDLETSTDVAVARGTVSNDTSGARQATLLVKPSTQAVMTLPNNSTVNLDTVHIRATEFTVGANGPNAMPAELPPVSGYTYALELSLDEALNAQAKDVTFSQPLPFYVENFLHFPVGETVPAGYYDKQKGAWVASESGRILQILSVTSGMADVDVTGDGVADTGTALSSLGIDDAERARLASLYSTGQSLWRVPIRHFSSWDANWGIFPPDNAKAPDGTPSLDDRGDGEGKCNQTGSQIECQSQTLGEEVGIVGTPFALHYRSEWQLGRRAMVKIPLSGFTLPGPVQRIDLVVNVAGREFKESFPAVTNQVKMFVWDGRDEFGRLVQGRTPINVRIGNVYQGVYRRTDKFNGFPQGSIGGDKARQEIILWKTWSDFIGTWDAKAEGLGGFTLSAHRVYDAVGRQLLYGDGRSRNPAYIPGAIRTIAGNGQFIASGDGGPASAARVQTPDSLALGADGTIYFSDGSFCIRKIAPNGIINTFAGVCGQSGFAGDGGPATSARLRAVTDLAIAPDGSVYIADTNNHRIRRVDANGIIQTVAGNPVSDGFSGWTGAFAGDGGPATLAKFNHPRGIDFAPDGTLYVADSDNNRVRRIGTDGLVETVAGIGPTGCVNPTEIPANTARLCAVSRVRVAADGSYYIVESSNQRIRRVTTDGIIHVFAGSGQDSYSGDGGPATAAAFHNPADVALARDGRVYIVDQNSTVRVVDVDGTIHTIVGSPSFPSYSGDGGPAAAAGIAVARGLKVALDGTLYIADSTNNRLRAVSPPLPGFANPSTPIMFPSEDGSVVDMFDGTGRLLETRDALTSASLYTFAYSTSGKLTSVTDVDGNVTQIEYDTAGNPARIVAPFGQITTLHVDTNGYLDAITNPAGEATHFTFSADGLMGTMTDPRMNVYQFHYDDVGRLERDDDPAGGYKTLDRVDGASSFLIHLQTRLGRVSSYETIRQNTGTTVRNNRGPDGLMATFAVTLRGTRTANLPDGTATIGADGPDPRFGMLSPVSTTQTTLPSGVNRLETMQRDATLGSGGSLVTLTERSIVNNTNTWTRAYDAATRKWTLTSPAGRKSFVTLDPKSHVVATQVQGLLERSLQYDSRGRPSTLTQGPRTQTFAYNADGFLQSTTDSAARTTSLLRDPAGRPTSQTDPDGSVVGFGYDANGNLTSLTPAGRPAHDMSYTPVNLLSTYTPPAVPGSGLTLTTYTSDFDRFLSQVLRPDNQTVSYGYDTSGRLSAITIPTGTITYTYYPSTGKLQTIAGPAGETVTFGYDGKLLNDVAYSGVVTGSVHTVLDNQFRIDTETVNGAQSAKFIYDTDGLLTNAGALTLTPDPQNGLLSGTAVGGVSDNYGYNGHGELTSQAVVYQGTPLFSETYTRDLLGRVETRTETVQGTTHAYGYVYDSAGRLQDVNLDGSLASHYAYGTNGNRESVTTPGGTTSGTYDAQDRLLTYGTNTYSYGTNGELSSRTDTVTGQITQYGYDARGVLTHVGLPDGTAIDYIIDGLGRRVGKRVNGTLTQGFLYRDALRIIAETDGAGNIVSRFVYATRANVPDYMVKGGNTYRLITDRLGSVRLVVNVADGSVAQRIDYDEFGQATNNTNPGYQPFGFAGGLLDTETRLLRLGARDYDMQTGRWTSKDPILFDGKQTNLYGYVNADPINNVDPRGNVGFYCGGGVGAALGFLISAGGDLSGGFFVDFSSEGISVGGYSSRAIVAGAGLYVSAGGEAGIFSSLDAFKGYSTIGKLDLGLLLNGAVTSGAVGGNDSGFTFGTSVSAGGGLFLGGGVSNVDVLGYRFNSTGGNVIF